MIHKHSDCRVLAVPNDSLRDLRWSFDLAITALENEFGVKRGPFGRDQITPDQQAHLKRLDALRMAIHEDY
jgi:hypothetical protein